MSDSPARPTEGKALAATRSIHGDFLEEATPQWLVDATPARKAAFKDTVPVMPGWYKNASPEQRNTVDASFKASTVAQVRLDKTMSAFQDIDTFARPLLLKALKDQFQVEVDVDATLICLRRSLAISVAEISVGSFESLRLPLLQAALHNFEAWECKTGAYHATSGFVVRSSAPDTFVRLAVNLTVSQFLTLCRSLDVGAKYQAYLKAFFEPADTTARATLREHFIASQKATLKAAADQALLIGDIKPADHTMLLSVINGEVHPWMGKKQVWFRDLSLMKKRLTGCVVFIICEKYRYSDEFIVYIPHDPAHPLKRYGVGEIDAEFKRLFTARDGMAAGDLGPTPYQRFFSQFVPYDQRGYYFSQFTQEAADSPSSALASPWRTIIEAASAVSFLTQIKELPPARRTKVEPAPDPYLAPSSMLRKGTGIWSANVDLWDYLYEQNRDKVYADARSHAVPTNDVDVKAREAKLAHLLEVGLLGLNLVSMFVPVLGEVMMLVMAGQLLYETFEGSIEWAEGDKRAAKAHLIDVAENLAQLAVMAGVGAAVGRYRAVKAEPLIEGLSPVILPSGETRLWKPDLSGYESPVKLDASPGPNALGQHTLNGKTYIRQGNKVYEQFFDESIKKWRIRHPTRAEVYQPILDSNGRGAWRHTLERPLDWDRLTLLRRMGHETEAFSDTELIKLADVSGVSDDALRKMHMDHAPPPPELADAMRMLKADAKAEQVIEQLRGAQPINEHYLYALPLVAEMPRWPQGRMLEVFDGPGLSGASVKYGSRRVPRGDIAKAPIRLSRTDVLNGQMPARVLAALDESEVTRLLGAEPARVPPLRPQEFARQIADYAETRKPAIFDSIYTGTEPVNAQVERLQRICPGLSEAGAREALAHAPADTLKQLADTGRPTLTLLEDARWYARQGRQTRAYAGLRSENIASAGSRRLALHTLEKLAGWPQDVRLEVREGTSSGALLDSIGSDTARTTKYLVKKGPRFQAFNERGEELNSLPKAGDNFYASLMHAMPDEARTALGVPQVSQSAALQHKIVEFADQYRSDAAQLLEPQTPWFKPPVRVHNQLLGYPASGRGDGLSARVRVVYPELSDAQADGFVRQLRKDGKNDRQIFNFLQNREREYHELATTLEGWVGPSGSAPLLPWDAAYQRTQLAQLLKDSWRRAPLTGEVADAGRLEIIIAGDHPLPPLAIDFPHVRELVLKGPTLYDAYANDFLARFPNVEKLHLEIRQPLESYSRDIPARTTLPQAVSAMTQLKSLRFHTNTRLSVVDFSSKLRALTSLEDLHVDYNQPYPSQPQGVLDLSSLVNLKKLKIDAPFSWYQWPAFVEALPQLERLDLSRTTISTLPETLYTGHEKLWAGLSLDWSHFSRAAFKPPYEYVKNYPTSAGHLMDLDHMVSQYAKGELTEVCGSTIAAQLHEKIMTTWDTPETRYAAVEALSEEYQGLFGQFYAMSTSAPIRFKLRGRPWQTRRGMSVVQELESSWRGAVAKRYGLEASVSVLELPTQSFREPASASEGSLVKLPELPAGTFAHVKTLRLGWLGESMEQTRRFIRAFSATQTLEIKAVGLT